MPLTPGTALRAQAVGKRTVISVWCLACIVGLGSQEAAVAQEFVQPSFVVPDTLETSQFRLRMLTVEDVEKDYEAVVESRELLQAHFGGEWPREGFTLEENLRDLERHAQDFQQRKGFTFTMVTLDEERVLGCVYIYPTELADADAQVRLWVRQSEQENGLDRVLFQTVQRWMSEEWPFERVTYPFREP